ncbi:hypothetical protein D3C86_1218330 [compost metagenome]
MAIDRLADGRTQAIRAYYEISALLPAVGEGQHHSIRAFPNRVDMVSQEIGIGEEAGGHALKEIVP